MKSPFDFFDHIYCINLERRIDRWEACRALFKRYGIVGRVECFKGVEMSKHPQFGPKILGRAGCTLSHFNIALNALENKYRNYLVFEDDVDFAFEPDEFLSLLGNSVSELPENWDMFYFGGNLSFDYGVKPIEAFSTHLFKLNACHTTHAFAVNSRFYRKLLHEGPNEESIFQWLRQNETVDVFLCRSVLRNNQCFIGDHLLAVQKPSYSDIEQAGYDYRRWMLNNFEQGKTWALAGI
jgi:hypothetical protein